MIIIIIILQEKTFEVKLPLISLNTYVSCNPLQKANLLTLTLDASLQTKITHTLQYLT